MKIALFDLDETLIKGDSFSLWNNYLFSLGWVDQAFMEIDNEFAQTYDRGNMNIIDYMKHVIKPLYENGRTVDDVTKEVNIFIEKIIKPRIYPQAKLLINQYFAEKYHVIIISATAEFLVKPIAKIFNINDVIAIKTKIKDNKYTNQIDGVLSYQEGKVIRLKEYLGDTWKEYLKGAYFYSDSHNDIPLLELVDNPVATNPNPRLIEYAKEKNIPIINWEL